MQLILAVYCGVTLICSFKKCANLQRKQWSSNNKNYLKFVMNDCHEMAACIYANPKPSMDRFQTISDTLENLKRCGYSDIHGLIFWTKWQHLMHYTWFLRCPRAWTRRWSPTQRTWKPKNDKICRRSRILKRRGGINSIWMRFKSSTNTASSWMTYFQISHLHVAAIFKIPAL